LSDERNLWTETAQDHERWIEDSPAPATGRQWRCVRPLTNSGFSMKEITAKTGLKRTTLYRHLPPRSPPLTG
jgi:hypothetical protein